MEQPQRRYNPQTIRRSSNLGLAFLGGLALGATLVYFLEPRTRLRRQAVFRDRTVSLAHHYLLLGGKLSRHLRNRFQGLIAVTSDAFRPAGIDSDGKIEARVRAVLGRATRHPHAVNVSVSNGRVTLRGTLAPHEAGVVVRATEHVKGVKHVENLLTPPLAEGASPIQ